MTTTTKKLPMKIRFADVNRHKDDKSYLPIISAVAFDTKAEDGIIIRFKERVSYEPGDSLIIKHDDRYGNADSSDGELNG